MLCRGWRETQSQSNSGTHRPLQEELNSPWTTHGRKISLALIVVWQIHKQAQASTLESTLHSFTQFLNLVNFWPNMESFLYGRIAVLITFVLKELQILHMY